MNVEPHRKNQKTLPLVVRSVSSPLAGSTRAAAVYGVTKMQSMDTKTITVCSNVRRGWYLLFASGFESAMPNKNAAVMLAAAPELLEVVYLYLELSPDQPPNLTAMARAAIARAEGTPEVRELPTDDDLSERTGLNMEDWVEDVRQGNTKLGYSDSAQQGDIAAIHRQSAKFLALPCAVPMREMSQDERDDTVLGR